MKAQYIQALTWLFGISLLRLSVQRSYKRILYSTIVLVVLITTGCALTLILQCLPVEAAWDMTKQPPPFGTGTARCYSLNTFKNLGLMNSAFNIATDVLFAALPIPLIWQLSLNVRTKVSLILILSLGWFACAAGIIKAVKQASVLSDPDWSVKDSFNVWSMVSGARPDCIPQYRD
jgi:hypothetical protein